MVLIAGGLALFAAGGTGEAPEIITVDAARAASAGDGVFRLDADDAEAERPRDLGALVAIAPDAALSTNSRGETLAAVRGRTERSLRVYYDGAPIEDPWDGRLDLARLPALAVQGIALAPYPTSGFDSAGGPVLAVTPGAVAGARLALEAGDFSYRRLAAGFGSKRGFIAGEVASRDAAPLSDEANLPFSEDGSAARDNTDYERVSGAFRLIQETGAGLLSLSGLIADNDYGVAAEGHIDPAIDSPRYWRLPEDRRSILVAKLSSDALEFAAWGQRAEKRIDQYENADYAIISERETGDDIDFGARGSIAASLAGWRARFGAETRDSLHRETSGSIGSATPEDVFRRRTSALSLDLSRSLGERWSVAAGARGDAIDTLAAGGRPQGPDFSGWSGRAEARFAASDAMGLRLAGGRSLRIPTQRELYGAALGRFLVNPDLKPETSIYGEGEISYATSRLAASLIGFAEKASDTIDQEKVDVSGSRLRRRINLDGVDIAGLSGRVAADLTAFITVSAGGTIQRISVRGEDDDRIAERPEALARARIAWRSPRGLGALIEADHRGEAYSIGADGDLVALEASTRLNLEVSYRKPGERSFEVFARLENATDAALFPQAGLPADGRLFRIGAQLAV